MKAGITGYITGAINNHNRILESMKKYEYSKTLIQSHQNCIDELSDLAEFVIDIPEELATDTYKEITRLRNILAKEEYSSEQQAFEIIGLKQRAAELEESCENMNEVGINLHGKIKTLESNATWLRTQLLENDKIINQIKEVNSLVWEENRQLKLLNKKSFRKIKILKNKLKNKLRGGK